jgi:hypothetical protein
MNPIRRSLTSMVQCVPVRIEPLVVARVHDGGAERTEG